ncbi:Aquaporin [Arachis hypogaea]|nr:Aquaporin [Arachis hypogaea]
MKNCKCLSFPPLAKKVAAVFVGTFMLMFAGIAAAIMNEKTNGLESLLGCVVVTGLAVTVIILSTGHISSAHLNPAVTISFAAIKHFPWKKVPMYIGAQILASMCAAFALKEVYHPFMGEFIISFNLMFVVTAFATHTRTVGQFAGMALGATVTFNILITGPVSGGSMNSVRTLGPAIAANNYKAIWIYLTAPILGAFGGAGAYCVIKLPDDENSEL